MPKRLSDEEKAKRLVREQTRKLFAELDRDEAREARHAAKVAIVALEPRSKGRKVRKVAEVTPEALLKPEVVESRDARETRIMKQLGLRGQELQFLRIICDEYRTTPLGAVIKMLKNEADKRGYCVAFGDDE
jgi:hypothetical protein